MCVELTRPSAAARWFLKLSPRFLIFVTFFCAGPRRCKCIAHHPSGRCRTKVAGGAENVTFLRIVSLQFVAAMYTAHRKGDERRRRRKGGKRKRRKGRATREKKPFKKGKKEGGGKAFSLFQSREARGPGAEPLAAGSPRLTHARPFTV